MNQRKIGLAVLGFFAGVLGTAPRPADAANASAANNVYAPQSNEVFRLNGAATVKVDGDSGHFHSSTASLRTRTGK